MKPRTEKLISMRLWRFIMTHAASNAAARLSFSFRTVCRHSHAEPSTKAIAKTVPTRPVSAMVCSR